MRQIKFRALADEMSPYFVYGDLIYDNGVPKIKSSDGMFFKTCLKGTEGQNIGEQDKNKKDIYEGDIVKRKDSDKIGIIQFARGTFGINWDYCKDINPEWKYGCMYGSWGALHNLRRIDDDILSEFEIIGSIHLNHELFETTK